MIRGPLRRSVVLLFALALAGSGDSARGEQKSVRCVLDAFDGVFAPGGYVILTGWAADDFDGAPVPKIEIYLDRSIPGEDLRGFWRPDVLAHFARPDFLWAGWSGTLSLKGIRPGQHSAEAFAVSRAGKRISCGRHVFAVKNLPPSPEISPGRAGTIVLGRTIAFVLWLTFLGLALARLWLGPAALLGAPVVGLALFAIVAEAGGALHARPFVAAAVLTLVSGMGLVWLVRRRTPFRRPPRGTVPALLAAVLFAVVGTIPLAVHGKGAVLGEIDDGIRECTFADSIARFGWQVPPDARGYLSLMRTQMENTEGRRGGTHLLAAVARAFGTRAHEMYSPVVLGIGFVVVLTTGLIGFHVLRRYPGQRWLAPLFVAVNSVVVTNLYTQHLGTLLAAALLLFFVSSLLVLVRSSRVTAIAPVTLAIAAAWSLYPEAIPTWGMTAVLALGVALTRARRYRVVVRLCLAALLSILLNPVAVARVARSWTKLSREPTLSSDYDRRLVGDTRYFPSLTVISGVVPYRLDAPAPMGRVRSRVVPIATGLIVLVSLLGWGRLSTVEKRIVLLLLVPVGLGLYVAHGLDFPYGFAKLLTLAAPLWCVAFVLFVATGLARQAFWVRSISVLSLGLVLTLCLPSVRHVINHELRGDPPYDREFESLPALARTVGSDAVIRADEYPRADRNWLLYFLGDNAVEIGASKTNFPLARHFRLVDRRRSDLMASEAPVASTRFFSLVPIAAETE